MRKYSTGSQSEGRKIAEGALPRLCAGDIARRRTPGGAAVKSRTTHSSAPTRISLPRMVTRPGISTPHLTTPCKRVVIVDWPWKWARMARGGGGSTSLVLYISRPCSAMVGDSDTVLLDSMRMGMTPFSRLSRSFQSEMSLYGYTQTLPPRLFTRKLHVRLVTKRFC